MRAIKALLPLQPTATSHALRSRTAPDAAPLVHRDALRRNAGGHAVAVHQGSDSTAKVRPAQRSLHSVFPIDAGHPQFNAGPPVAPDFKQSCRHTAACWACPAQGRQDNAERGPVCARCCGVCVHRQAQARGTAQHHAAPSTAQQPPPRPPLSPRDSRTLSTSALQPRACHCSAWAHMASLHQT